MENISQLDWKTTQILKAISENGGDITTSEAKTRTGIERNQSVLHRFEKLETAGLVETYQPTPEEGARIPPKEAILTEDGETFIADNPLDSHPDEETVDQRLDRMEHTLNQFDARLDRIEDALGISDDVDHEAVNVVALMDGFVAIEEYLRQEANADLRQHHPRTYDD